MRLRELTFAAACCALLAACGSPGAQAFNPRPGEHFRLTRAANAGATLSDLASQVTTDTVLRYKGAKLTKAEPFGPCPGEAGLQTFDVRSPQGAAVLHVAFTQWNGMAVTASYERPANRPDDPSAVQAMRRTVCTSPLGG